jgi:uncharacterized membrane protein YqjE
MSLLALAVFGLGFFVFPIVIAWRTWHRFNFYGRWASVALCIILFILGFLVLAVNRDPP